MVNLLNKNIEFEDLDIIHDNYQEGGGGEEEFDKDKYNGISWDKGIDAKTDDFVKKYKRVKRKNIIKSTIFFIFIIISVLTLYSGMIGMLIFPATLPVTLVFLFLMLGGLGSGVLGIGAAHYEQTTSNTMGTYSKLREINRLEERKIRLKKPKNEVNGEISNLIYVNSKKTSRPRWDNLLLTSRPRWDNLLRWDNLYLGIKFFKLRVGEPERNVDNSLFEQCTLVIDDVYKDSLAQEIGLKKGDMITGLRKIKTYDFENIIFSNESEFNKIWENMNAGTELILDVRQSIENIKENMIKNADAYADGNIDKEEAERLVRDQLLEALYIRINKNRNKIKIIWRRVIRPVLKYHYINSNKQKLRRKYNVGIFKRNFSLYRKFFLNKSEKEMYEAYINDTNTIIADWAIIEGHIFSIVTGGNNSSDINLGKQEMDKSLKAIKEIINKNIKEEYEKEFKEEHKNEPYREMTEQDINEIIINKINIKKLQRKLFGLRKYNEEISKITPLIIATHVAATETIKEENSPELNVDELAEIQNGLNERKEKEEKREQKIDKDGVLGLKVEKELEYDIRPKDIINNNNNNKDINISISGGKRKKTNKAARKNDGRVINKFFARRFSKLNGKAVVAKLGRTHRRKKTGVRGNVRLGQVVNKVSRRVSKLGQFRRRNNTLKRKKKCCK